MSPKRGVQVTVVLLVLVLAVFAVLTLFPPDQDQEGAPASSGATGGGGPQAGPSGQTVTEAQFGEWLNGARENITSLADQIETAGTNMDLGTARALNEQLLEKINAYVSALGSMTVSPTVEKAKVEFMAALEDYRQASIAGAEAAESMDMDQVSVAMDYYRQASAHADSAVRELGSQG